jgi:hypothetical protein
MTYPNGNAQAHRQVLQRNLPQAGTAAVATPSVGVDQQFLSVAVSLGPHRLPPTLDSLRGKARSAMF